MEIKDIKVTRNRKKKQKHGRLPHLIVKLTGLFSRPLIGDGDMESEMDANRDQYSEFQTDMNSWTVAWWRPGGRRDVVVAEVGRPLSPAARRVSPFLGLQTNDASENMGARRSRSRYIRFLYMTGPSGWGAPRRHAARRCARHTHSGASTSTRVAPEWLDRGEGWGLAAMKLGLAGELFAGAAA